jgi:hypothetical protein
MNDRANSTRPAAALCALILFLAVAPLTASGADADAVAGEWEIVQTFGERKNYSQLEIKKADDGALSATWNAQPLTNVKFENDKLNFVRTIAFGDQSNEIDYSGTLKDGRIDGQVSSDWGDFPAVASRIKPLSPAVGAWRVTFQIGDRDAVNFLTVSRNDKDELVGTNISEGATHVVSNVKFDAGKLTFDRKTTVNDFELDLKFAGEIKDGELTGAYTGERGDIPVKAERLGVPFVGDWELTGEFNFGGPTRTLRIYPDLSARYQLFDGLTPVDEAAIEGDKMNLKLQAGFGDNSFTMEIKGTLEGDKLTGEIGNPQGATAFTGKKVK